jgi:hypothetical protein
VRLERGNNHNRRRTWKTELAALAAKTGLVLQHQIF